MVTRIAECTDGGRTARSGSCEGVRRGTGAGIDRQLRVVHTPEILPGDAVEVTALWDLRDGPGDYVITVTADAFSQIDRSARTAVQGRYGPGYAVWT